MTVITLNGEPCELGEAATIESAVRALVTDDARGVAVALDGEVIPRGEWATTAVREGQQVEVLHAVQGGS
jgi:sulfur carrier protein